MRRAASLTAVVVLAGGEALLAAVGGEAHHAPSIVDLLWPVLNFGLFLLLLWHFAWPVVRQAFAERRTTVEAAIAEAALLRDEARNALAEAERLRTGEAAERERMLEDLRVEGENEARALVAAARRAGERMREDARRLGESESARAVQELRRRVAAEAGRRAEEEIRRRLGEAEESRFLNGFLEGVGAEAPR